MPLIFNINVSNVHAEVSMPRKTDTVLGQKRRAIGDLTPTTYINDDRLNVHSLSYLIHFFGNT